MRNIFATQRAPASKAFPPNVLAFFNNKGGVGKTSLLYHVAHALAADGVRVLVVDFDPQANLTSFFLTDQELEAVWDSCGIVVPATVETVYSAIRPLLDGEGEIPPINPLRINSNLFLLPGDLRLSDVEDELSAQWSRCLNGEVRAFRVTAGFHKTIQQAAEQASADVVFIDVGPNLGAINRSALVASDFLIVPMGADLFSNRGLRNLGPKLQQWRVAWHDRLTRAPSRIHAELPTGRMETLGFSINVFNTYNGAPAQAFAQWIDRAPLEFARAVGRRDERDHLAQIRNYGALMPAAQRARKPIFELRSADGVVGSHLNAAHACGTDMLRFGNAIIERMASLATQAAA